MLLTLGIILALGFVGSLLPATTENVSSEQTTAQVSVIKKSTN